MENNRQWMKVRPVESTEKNIKGWHGAAEGWRFEPYNPPTGSIKIPSRWNLWAFRSVRKEKECTHTKRFFVVLCVRHMFNQLRHTSRPFRRIQLTVVTTTSTLSYNLKEKKKRSWKLLSNGFWISGLANTNDSQRWRKSIKKKRHKKVFFYLLLIVESLRTFDIGKLLFNSSNPKRLSHAKATSEKVSSVIRLCSWKFYEIN